MTVAAGERVDLLFASTRLPSGNGDPSRFLGNRPGPLIFGQCTVRYEDSPRSGRWSGYGDFFLPGDDRAVIGAATTDEGGFLRALGVVPETEPVADPSAKSSKPRVVLFVHGYAYAFDRACRRVSDLQVVLGDSVRVVLFSWPSLGNPLRYGGDREALKASLPALIATIRMLSGAVGPEALRIAAHSMGGFGVLEALSQFDTPLRGQLATDLVLIAPDYGARRFRSRFTATARYFDRVTLYASSGDFLLKLSSLVNGERRLGQGGEALVLIPGLETIDVSALPRHHPAAHEYQYYNPYVVADLVELLRDGRGASDRGETVARNRDGIRYWVLEAEAKGAPR